MITLNAGVSEIMKFPRKTSYRLHRNAQDSRRRQAVWGAQFVSQSFILLLLLILFS